MASLFKKYRKKPGLPPGTAVYTGEHLNPPTIESFCYSQTDFEETPTTGIHPNFLEKATVSPESVTWLNFSGLSDTVSVEKLCTAFGIHSLIIEDIVQVNQRPKFEDHEEHIYLTLKMMEWNEKTESFEFEHTSLVLALHAVLSFQELTGSDAFEWVRKRLRKNLGTLRRSKADALFVALIDAIVDSYFVALEKFGDKLQNVETRILTRSTRSDIHEINTLKRSLILLRKAITPLREALGSLIKSESQLLNPNLQPYLRDVYDHVLYTLDLIETYRDFVNGLMETHLSSLSYKLNEVMKVLAVFTTIFSPLTFIVGVYGMNFDFFPELKWKYSYAVVWAVMLTVTAVMLVWFKRKKWL